MVFFGLPSLVLERRGPDTASGPCGVLSFKNEPPVAFFG